MPQGGPRPTLQAPAVPAGLPKEFELYLRGLSAYRRADLAAARVHFGAVLALPPAERRYRSTWAAFLVGRMYVDTDPGRAVAGLEQVRRLVEQGYRDRLGLAAASLGWQARAALNLKRYDQAFDLYLAQLATGDATAVASLRITVAKSLAGGPEILATLARHAPSRRVITAYVVTASGWSMWDSSTGRRRLDGTTLRAWLRAVEQTGAVDVAGADRLAWAAYQAGEMAQARRWIDMAPRDAPIAQWIAAKLLIRDGKLDAAAMLARVSKLFPQHAGSDRRLDDLGQTGRHPESMLRQALGELAVLRLARRQYVEALDALLGANLWTDAAYVAERVLTPDELSAYVDQSWPAPERDDLTIARSLRHLLARRLTRIGQWREARAYFAAEYRPKLDAYIGCSIFSDAANSS